MAADLAETLSRLEPKNQAFYQANARRFAEQLEKKVADWTKALAPFKGTKVITYHKSFDYFLEKFGLELVGTVEPKPGVEPSPTYINSLLPRIKDAGVKLVIIEPFRPRKTPQYIAQAIGARLLIVPEKVGANENVKDYLGLFDYDVAQIAAALKEAK